MSGLRSIFASFLIIGPLLAADEPPAFHSWAERPVMGWNSWDFYGTTVTETQTKAQADYMAANLLSHGWNLITVDIQWYAPNPAGDGSYFNYDTPNSALVMDGYGRLQPATTRFPSAAGGSGFTSLAAYVHSKGLKFGIHIMRGIPRQAVIDDLPVFGTDDGTGNPYTAQDIADTSSTCPWNPDMYGVDMTKPGAQAYYDSLFAMYALWGVDFVKVDDISRPYSPFHQAEIEAIRAAIDKTGRPMVLSLSPGETPLAKGDHVILHANQWRISDDFWDNWGALYDQFQRLHDWTPYRGPGYFPDADMLPLGKISASGGNTTGRSSNFTENEKYTLMTLWAIARSPLIHGGDMTQMDASTLSLLTNDEVIAVNQYSEHNRQLYRNGDRVIWVADAEGSSDKYLAVFNTSGSTDNVPVDLDAMGFTGGVQIRSLWDKADLGSFTNSFLPSVPSHGAKLYRLSGPLLPTPWITGVTADEASATVTWEVIPSATSYTVKRATSETGPFLTTVASGLTGIEYTDTTVEERTTYYYVVSAIISGQQSPDSPPRAVTTTGVSATVSWNLDNYSTIGGGGAGELPGPSALAGVVSAGNWTNSWPTDIRTDLIDETGQPTTVDIDYSGTNRSLVDAHPGQDSDGSWNREMLNGYLNAGFGDSSTVSISQIPHDFYDIIVYFSSRGTGRSGSITDGSTTYYFGTVGPSSTAGANAIMARTTDTVGSSPPAANYAIFRNLTGNSKTITCTIPMLGGIAAFQILPRSAAEFGLISYWPFDETSGTVATDKWSEQNGTLAGGAGFAQGLFGNALHLNQSASGHVVLPAGIVSALNDFTIATWVNIASDAAGQQIFDFGNDPQNCMFLTSKDAGTGLPRFSIVSGGAAQTLDATVPLPVGTWHHIAVTLAGNTASLYIDGALVGANSSFTRRPSDLGETTANYLGRSQNAPAPFLDGSLDDFRLYDRALPSNDIVNLPAPVAAPQNLAATAGPLEISLTWDEVAGANSYTIWTTTGGLYTPVASGLTTPSYIDSNLSFGDDYSYIVTAQSSSGSSFGSAEAAETPLSALISAEELQAPFVTVVDGNTVRITTAAPTVAGHSYQLQMRDNLATGGWTNVGMPVAGTGSPHTFEVALESGAARQFYRVVVDR